MEMEPQIITALEAAELLHVSRVRVLKLLRDGRICGRKAGGGPLSPWLVERESVLAWRPGKRGPGKKSKPLQTQDLRDSPETALARQ